MLAWKKRSPTENIYADYCRTQEKLQNGETEWTDHTLIWLFSGLFSQNVYTYLYARGKKATQFMSSSLILPEHLTLKTLNIAKLLLSWKRLAYWEFFFTSVMILLFGAKVHCWLVLNIWASHAWLEHTFYCEIFTGCRWSSI